MPVAAPPGRPFDGDAAGFRVVGEQLCHIDVECASDLQRRRDGRNALAALDLGQVALGQTGAGRHLFQRHTALLAHGA
jgi:hypothetical protein